VRDDERESLKRRIRMAEEMLANLPADVPRRDTVVAAMQMVIAGAQHELADADRERSDGEPKRRSPHPESA
jgi:hypothetical protein